MLAMMIVRLLFVSLAAALVSVAVFAQEAATTNRQTELKAEPKVEAATVATLPEGTNVKAVARQSGWTKVEAEQKSGWVRVFHLRFKSTVGESSEGGGSKLLSFLGGAKREPDKQIATVGVRGLSEQDLKSASPNPEAFKKMQSFRADKPTGERYAHEAKLAAVSVEYVESASQSSSKGGRK
jgi:uncharacterized protein YgiM (DUF1202 family)